MEIEEEDHNIVNNFNSDEEFENDNEEEKEEDNLSENKNHWYNPNIYNFKYVYTYFTTNGIMKSTYRCPICNNVMNLVKEKTFFDKECFAKNQTAHMILKLI